MFGRVHEEVEEDEVTVPEIEHFDDAMKLYLQEIQKIRLLTADEEKELAGRIAQGDKAARNRMIESNLRLVVKIAKRHLSRGLPFLDLIEEGNIGLIKAVERFKSSKECRFSTYATWWIRQSIDRAVMNQARTIRLPVHVSDDVSKMSSVTRVLVRKANREPSTGEVATEMGVDIAYVRRLMVLRKNTCSLERPLGEESDYTLLNILRDNSTVPVTELCESLSEYELVAASLKKLHDHERKILTLRFGLDDHEPQTLDTIGQTYGLTRERIRQIEAKAFAKLRKIVQRKSCRH